MNVIFMGTPEFSVSHLKAIIDSDHTVKAVFTNMPKCSNRGLKLNKSPVHIFAEKNNIPVFTPKSLKTFEVYELIKNIEAEVIVVVAYGFIIPKNILELKKYGCINVHPSLLPKYRGASPMQYTILNGETKTATCTMQMDEGMDTGDIILMEQFSIDQDITLDTLENKAAAIGAKLLIKTLDNINTLPRYKQSDEGVSLTKKISKSDGKISWSEPAIDIERKIRAFSVPVFFELGSEKIKVVKAKAEIYSEENKPAGFVLDEELRIMCGRGVLKILELQRPGKRILKASDFLNGNNIIKRGMIL